MKFKLFRYSKINNYLIESLTENYLYFSKASDFNDPFDCMPKIKFNGNNSDFKRFFDKNGIEFNNSKELKDEILRLKSLNCFEFAEKHNLMSRYRVCCFTGNSKNILMWSHYADSHKGICIEYEFDLVKTKDGYDTYCTRSKNGYFENGRIKDILCAIDVEYVKEMISAYNPIYRNSERLIDFARKKFIEWKYEDEKRIIIEDSHLKKGPRVKLQENCVTGIYFGLKTSSKDIEQIKNIFNSSNSKVKFYNAKISESGYGIIFK